jgi:hypothetical protein
MTWDCEKRAAAEGGPAWNKIASILRTVRKRPRLTMNMVLRPPTSKAAYSPSDSCSAITTHRAYVIGVRTRSQTPSCPLQRFVHLQLLESWESLFVEQSRKWTTCRHIEPKKPAGVTTERINWHKRENNNFAAFKACSRRILSCMLTTYLGYSSKSTTLNSPQATISTDNSCSWDVAKIPIPSQLILSPLSAAPDLPWPPTPIRTWRARTPPTIPVHSPSSRCVHDSFTGRPPRRSHLHVHMLSTSLCI